VSVNLLLVVAVATIVALLITRVLHIFVYWLSHTKFVLSLFVLSLGADNWMCM